jgi:DNA-binding transcriptional MerR regulator
MHRIGGFSRLAQVPVKTRRYYDNIGLLRPARVERATGYRYYEAAQLEQLNRILAFKDLGFSLLEVRALVADNVPLGQLRAMVRRKNEELEQRVERERARLARAAAYLDVIEASGQARAPEVAVRAVGPRLVASVRRTVAGHEESEGLFDELHHHIGGRPGHRPRGAVWHACADRAIDCEAFVFLPSRVAGDARVRVYEMPAHRAASLVYRGEEDFPRAYHAIRAWLDAAPVEVVGPKREIFLEEGNPSAESVTEIQFPIAAFPAEVGRT